jgi:hypothetical protein
VFVTIAVAFNRTNSESLTLHKAGFGVSILSEVHINFPRLLIVLSILAGALLVDKCGSRHIVRYISLA